MQDDLSSERQKHLVTVTDLRKSYEKTKKVEDAAAARLQDLLLEMAEKNVTLEELRDEGRLYAVRTQDAEERLLKSRLAMESMVTR